jgi:hypothetical protein
MRWGLSWGAQAPHLLIVAGVRYEVRTTRTAGLWTAYGTVCGVCVEATGSSEREARQKWQAKVEALSPHLQVERRVEQALDEAAAALDIAAETIAAQSAAAQPSASQPSDPAPGQLPPLHPETCEVRRSADRRLRPRLPREQ